MPSFIIAGYVWQILGRGGPKRPPPQPWAAPKKPILDRIKNPFSMTESSFKDISFLGVLKVTVHSQTDERVEIISRLRD